MPGRARPVSLGSSLGLFGGCSPLLAVCSCSAPALRDLGADSLLELLKMTGAGGVVAL